MTSCPERLDPRQLDALREAANIASGHAATALSQLTGRRVMITVPKITVAGVRQLAGALGAPDEAVVVVAMQMLGDVTGSLVFLMPEPKAGLLTGLLLHRWIGRADRLDALAVSSLRETANILGASYAGALGALMGGVIMLSVPTFGIESPDQVLARLHAPGEADQVALCIETKLTLPDDATEFGGHLVMLPSRAALGSLLSALRMRIVSS
jgi:chemotaxis protein CheC